MSPFPILEITVPLRYRSSLGSLPSFHGGFVPRPVRPLFLLLRIVGVACGIAALLAAHLTHLAVAFVTESVGSEEAAKTTAYTAVPRWLK